MLLSRKSLATAAFFIATAPLFSACPTGGGGIIIDMQQYWPMAVGNYWKFQGESDPNDFWVYSVVADHSTAQNDAWAITTEIYNNGTLAQSYTQYYIWRHDFLVRTSSEPTLQIVLANPDASSYNLSVEIELPRYANPSISPRLFKDVEPGERLYTMTGDIGQLSGQYECASEPDPELPANFFVPLNTPGVLQLGDDSCDGQPFVEGWDLFAEGVGPVDFLIGRLVEYSVSNS